MVLGPQLLFAVFYIQMASAPSRPDGCRCSTLALHCPQRASVGAGSGPVQGCRVSGTPDLHPCPSCQQARAPRCSAPAQARAPRPPPPAPSQRRSTHSNRLGRSWTARPAPCPTHRLGAPQLDSRASGPPPPGRVAGPAGRAAAWSCTTSFGGTPTGTPAAATSAARCARRPVLRPPGRQFEDDWWRPAEAGVWWLQLGHQAVNCTNGTINWRQIYGNDAFTLKPPMYPSDVDRRLMAKKIDFVALERSAREYAKVKARPSTAIRLGLWSGVGAERGAGQDMVVPCL